MVPPADSAPNARTLPMPPQRPAADVVASGDALRQAATLLGLPSVEAGLADAGPATVSPAPARAPGLGLGAAFIPHSLALDAAGGLERRLGGRLAAGARKRREEEGERAGARPGAPSPAQADLDSDDGGRAGAVREPRTGVDRRDLLAPPPPRKKQKKRREGVQSGGGGNGSVN